METQRANANRVRCAALVLVCGSACLDARAAFEDAQIEQVIGGVAGLTSAQAIQLRMSFGRAEHASPARMRAWNAQGAAPILVIDFASSVPNASAGARILIVSPSFSSLTTPPAVTDYMMTNPIPAAYLAAGSLTYESDTGIVYWRLSWGAYTGTGNGSTFNDPDGNFNPPFPNLLASGGSQAVLFPGLFNANSTNNAADYILTHDAAEFTNNAGASFTVGIPSGACCVAGGSCQELSPGDCGNNGGNYQGNNTTCGSSPCTPGFTCNAAPFVNVPSSNFGLNNSAPPDPTVFGCGVAVSTTDGVTQENGVWFRVAGTGHNITASTCSPGTNFDTRLRVYCGSCSQLSCVGGNDTASPVCTPSNAARLTWCSQLGQTYFIYVSGAGGSTGSFDLLTEDSLTCSGAASCQTCSLSAPANAIVEPEACGDELNGGCNLTPPAYTDTSCNTTIFGTSRTYISSPPAPFRDTDWYRFTLTSNQLVTWSATAEFPLHLIVFSLPGGGCPGTILSNIVSGPCVPGSTTLSLTPGTYVAFASIAVPGMGVFTGFPCDTNNDYIATLSCPPPNDTCAAATNFPIPPCPPDGNTSTITGSYAGAAPDAGAGVTCDSGAGQGDVYHRFTPAISGPYTLSLCGGGPPVTDTVLSIHTGACPVTDATQIAGVAGCNDDSCGVPGGFSILSGISLTAGTPYLVRIGGWSNTVAGGPYTLITTYPPDLTPPTILSCAANQTVSGGGDPCQAVVPNFLGPPLSATDNCGSVSFSQSPTAGTLVASGNTSITITATDSSGNFSVCAATLHVTACTDCNANGVEDVTDIATGSSRDCNGNDMPDECDLAEGASQDLNHNNLPDECEPACCRIERHGDWDGDCDVDLLDYSAFQICVRHNGEGGGSDCFTDGCSFTDINYDLQVDLLDYQQFHASIGLGGPGSSLPDCDPGGGSCDAWATGSNAALPFGGTYYVFGDPPAPVPPGYQGDHPAIPAGFFGSGSLPFEGVVELKGQAIDGVNSGSTDTIIEHPPLRFGFGDLPLCDIVPARLESLSLRSRDPIVVDQSVGPGDCNGNGVADGADITVGFSVDLNFNGVPDECEWYVAAVPSQVSPPDGSIDACKTFDNGGTFDATIYVQPLFVFVNKSELEAGMPLSPDSVKTLDTGIEGLPPIVFEFFDQPFVICTDSSLYQTPCSQGNFVPGVQGTPFGGGGTTCLSHISPGESHYFCPPECFEHLCTYPAAGGPYGVVGSCGAGCGPPICPAFPASLRPSDTGISGMDNCVGLDPSGCPTVSYFEISNFDPAVGMTADCSLPPPPGCFPLGLCLQGYGPGVICTATGNAVCP